MQDDKRQTVEDQELASMIASVNGATPTGSSLPPAPSPVASLPTPPPPAPAPVSPAPAPTTASVSSTPSTPPTPPVKPIGNSLPPIPQPTVPPIGAPTPPPAALPPVKPPTPPASPRPGSSVVVTSNLDLIKINALDELRLLVDDLSLPPDEKFDALLLLIRSTDDKELIKPAYEAAQQIKDDTKRASALLDVVKEIDFFENQT